MNIQTITFALVLAGSCFSANAGGTTPYEEASTIGKADSLDPQYRQWYLQTMRPAFSKVFQPLVNRCLAQVSRDEGKSLGVVFVVNLEGKAKQFFWRDRNAFSECLEVGLRVATFPAAPKEAFYFGLEATLQSGA
jgi:hypothetical protein